MRQLSLKIHIFSLLVVAVFFVLLSFNFSFASAYSEAECRVVVVDYTVTEVTASGSWNSRENYQITVDGAISSQDGGSIPNGATAYFSNPIATVFSYYWHETNGWTVAGLRGFGTSNYISVTGYGSITALTGYHSNLAGQDIDLVFPNGCEDVAPDPCDDLPALPDTDNDGLVDYCDAFINDPDRGKDLYGIIEYSTGGYYLSAVTQSEAAASGVSVFDVGWEVGDCTGVPILDVTGDSKKVGEMNNPVCVEGEWSDCGFAIGLEGGETDYDSPAPIDSLSVPSIVGPDLPDYEAPIDSPSSGTDNDLLQAIADNITTLAKNQKADAESAFNQSNDELLALLNANRKTDSTNEELSNIDTKLQEQNATLTSQSETLTSIDTKLQQQLDSETQTGQDDILQTAQSTIEETADQVESEQDAAVSSVQNDITDIQNTAPLGDSLFDNILDPLSPVLTTGSCEPMVWEIGETGKSLTISCEFSDHLKTILGFLLAVYTIMELTELLYLGMTPKGAQPIRLFGN
ncbi:hypothetical protein KAR91_83070 [Candidatus Pacearchaeota archaeon]|nr:hypothetical protein [Candidatus Pacearchaeota archaeon]